MIEKINDLYNKEVEDNKVLKKWIDKLSNFILINYYKEKYVNEEQWNFMKKKIVKEIIEGD